MKAGDRVQRHGPSSRNERGIIVMIVPPRPRKPAHDECAHVKWDDDRLLASLWSTSDLRPISAVDQLGDLLGDRGG